MDVLGLKDKTISHLSVSLSRATLLTTDNKVAVLVDRKLSEVADFIQVRCYFVILSETNDTTLYNKVRYGIIIVSLKLRSLVKPVSNDSTDY